MLYAESRTNKGEVLTITEAEGMKHVNSEFIKSEFNSLLFDLQFVVPDETFIYERIVLFNKIATYAELHLIVLKYKPLTTDEYIYQYWLGSDKNNLRFLREFRRER